MSNALPADHDERMARAQLALEGLSLGDAFGECFFSPGLHSRMHHRVLPEAPWFYTDDTMMAWSIVDVLAEHGCIEQGVLANLFAARFRQQPHRGYGAGAMRLLDHISEGVYWKAAAGDLFGGQGSMGNGGAMRVAPLGAYFADDLERVVHEATASAEVTHAHAEGKAGAVAVAVAAAIAWQKRGQKDAKRTMLKNSLALTPAGEVREGIEKAMTFAPDAGVEIVATALGSGQRVLAQDTVPYCLWCAAGHLDDFEEAMWTTVCGMGDIDTNCAIVGGIVSGFVGNEGMPADWLQCREPLEA